MSSCCGVGSDPDESTSQVFVEEDSDIQGPEDLAGKKIAVNSTKNLGDVTIPVALENNGIDPFRHRVRSDELLRHVRTL